MAMATNLFFIAIVITLFSCIISKDSDRIRRRILHEPLFPIQWTPPPPPASSSDPFPETPAPPSPFFPSAPPQSGNVIQTPTPPNTQSQSSPSSNSTKSKVLIGVSVSAALLAVLALLGFFLIQRRRRIKCSPPDARKLIVSDNDGGRRFQQAPDFLYLGTMEPSTERRNDGDSNGNSPYRKLSSERALEARHPSPELQPLPPLVRRTSSAPPPPPPEVVSLRRISSGATTVTSSDDDGFYTPNRSVASMTASESPSSHNPRSRRTSPRMQFSDCNSPLQIKHAIPTTNPPPPPPPPPPKVDNLTRPPPPPPPPKLPMLTRPSLRRQLLRPLPAEAVPSRLSNGSSSSSPKIVVVEDGDKLGEDVKPKLMPLHWDKVRARSDRAMVWDQMKSSSFQLNEDMFETLFVNNSTNPPPKETSSRKNLFAAFKQERRVLDPKKSQNISILLRALNVTREEVTEALLDGNPEGLGPELLETLVKMAPTKEEELILRDYNGDLSKLGSAERFLKAILDIPFAFKRVDAMLYRANFESEIRYLMKSFETLEAACEDLRSSGRFLRLLETILSTGNRLNVGTNRGEAKAFKLDTLLKLADVKGTDRKTTLLHFVVQEIIRSEGSSSDTTSEDPPNKAKEVEFRRQGLKVLAGLSSELGNVKKAAGMDSDVISGYVKKLELGLEKTRSVVQLERSCEQGLKFFDSMKVFVNEAEGEIGRVKAEEKRAMGLVKEVTEYFHGDAGKEEAHPLRIFMVVRDFLLVLDNVCKEVGKLHERTVMGSGSFRIATSASLPVLHRYEPTLHRDSD